MSQFRLPPTDELFPSIVDRMARNCPDRPFIRSSREGILSWAEFRECSETWLEKFVALGVRRGDVVANLMDASANSVGCWLSLTRLGAIEASVNTEFRGRILSYALNSCGARILLVQDEYIEILEQVADDLETVETVILLGDGEVAELGEIRTFRFQDLPSADSDVIAQARHLPSWHDTACITFTSGTTGPSKAVCLPWAQLHSVATATYPMEDMGLEDVIYSLSPNAHFGSKTMPYLAGLIGGQVVMQKRFSGTSFWQDVAEHKVTTAALISSMADILIRSPDAPGDDTSLRNIFMAPLSPGYVDFNERFGTRICTVYNSTEGGIAIRSGWNPENWRACGKLRSGYPGFEVRIVDEFDRELPEGEIGECIVRSGVPWTMNAGYLGNSDATAEAWRNGWFHTGDGMKRTPQGEFVFVDRIKDAIRRRGENISSFEVETDVMLNPGVQECAAVAVPGDGGEDEIMLFVVPVPSSELTPKDLCEEMVPRVARFMVPRYIEFVNDLPRTDATRRIKKTELRAQGVGPNTWDRQAAGVVIP